MRARYNNPMSALPDVLILGGGVIGLTTAYYLARCGAQVMVIDRGDLGRQASWAGAGIVPPGNPARATTPYDQLRAHSSSLYPKLSRDLHERTGIDNGYAVCGGVVIQTSTDELPEREWAAEGIVCQAVDGTRVQELEPDLRPLDHQAYYLPEMAQVRNPRHLRALEAACTSLGVQLRPHCTARALLHQAGRVHAIQTEAGPQAAASFLISAGAWTDELLAPLGWRPGIHPVRGQIALLNTSRPGVRPILLVGARYMVPRGDGHLLIGSTEEDAGFDARPTARGIAGLLTFAAEFLPPLAEAPLERCWAGLRPGSPDGMPFLGAVPGWDNVFVAAGHFRAGIQLSPATGLLMSQLLLGRAPFLSPQPFRLDRAPAPPARCAFRS